MMLNDAAGLREREFSDYGFFNTNVPRVYELLSLKPTAVQALVDQFDRGQSSNDQEKPLGAIRKLLGFRIQIIFSSET